MSNRDMLCMRLRHFAKEDLADGTLLIKTGLVAMSMFGVVGRANVKIKETFGLRRPTTLTSSVCRHKSA